MLLLPQSCDGGCQPAAVALLLVFLLATATGFSSDMACEPLLQDLAWDRRGCMELSDLRLRFFSEKAASTSALPCSRPSSLA